MDQTKAGDQNDSFDVKRLQEFNQSDLQDEETHVQMDVQSRHFRLHYQKLNTSKFTFFVLNISKEVLKFIKILTFNVKEDDLSCIVESRSLSLEYLSFKKLKTVYEQFYESFPTTLE